MTIRREIFYHFRSILIRTLLLTLTVGLAHGSLLANTLLVVAGPGTGHSPVVKITVDTGSGIDTIQIQPYRNGFMGGVRVAVGDVNGDGTADIITAPGPGMGAQIRIFNGLNGARLGNFLALPGFFRGGVFVAAGDVNGDHRADIIVGPDSGAPPLVRVFDGSNGQVLRSFFAYSPLFTGGVRVAAGDVNGDGIADIVTGAGPGSGPHVKVFDGNNLSEIRSFFPYSANFMGGVFVAAGDVNGDGISDVITGPGAGAGPQVKVFDGTDLNPLFNFFAYDASFQGGVRVAAGDVNNDRRDDIITGAGPGATPHLKVFDAVNLNPLHSFFAYEPSFAGGIFVAGNTGRVRRS
jgi:FG-GAP-like repeat/FG-GAP repeat